MFSSAVKASKLGLTPSAWASAPASATSMPWPPAWKGGMSL